MANDRRPDEARPTLHLVHDLGDVFPDQPHSEHVDRPEKQDGKQAPAERKPGVHDPGEDNEPEKTLAEKLEDRKKAEEKKAKSDAQAGADVTDAKIDKSNADHDERVKGLVKARSVPCSRVT